LEFDQKNKLMENKTEFNVWQRNLQSNEICIDFSMIVVEMPVKQPWVPIAVSKMMLLHLQAIAVRI